MQGPVVLPEDVQIIPLTDLPAAVRAQLDGAAGDFALTRPHSRTPSKVIDANAAALLEQFRDPTTIVDAILAYSKTVKARPADVLEEAYPLIESCLVARLLVEPGAASEKIQPSFTSGDRIGGHVVERPIQALIDSEVYQVKTPGGRLAALKIATRNALDSMKKMLAAEADLLRRIGGAPAPELMETGELEDGRAYILVEWFEGQDAHTAVQRLSAGADPAQFVAELCAGVLDAYARLHECGVVHADVHPRNVLVSDSREVRIIDFGIGHAVESEARRLPRAGVPFFFEPEYAQAARAGAPQPEATFAGEQYDVAALIYSLLCGQYYLDFSFDKQEMLRQIAEETPISFAERGAAKFECLEPTVRRALSKNPAERFDTSRQFALAFRHALNNMQTVALLEQAFTAPSTRDGESARLLDRVLAVVADPHHKLAYEGPPSPTTSLTYGSVGIAYAAYRIACAREDARMLALADAWVERAAGESGASAYFSPEIQITPETVGRVSPFHSPSGLAAVQALIANARSDTMQIDAAVNRYLHITRELPDNPDLTLGQASVLHGLTLLLEACGPEKPQALVERGDETCARIEDKLASQPPIGEGGDITYLGIAHGWAGVLYALLRWRQVVNKPAPGVLEDRLRQLAGHAQFTRRGARWPVQSRSGSVSLAGWCNGSAGHVHLWTLAHRVYREYAYLDLAERAAMDAFEQSGGGHALCCGFAGQAYAQLSLYQHTQDRRWLEQARVLTSKACALGNAMLSQRSDYLPHSLYKGDVGVAVLAAEIEQPEAASMPFFAPEP